MSCKECGQAIGLHTSGFSKDEWKAKKLGFHKKSCSQYTGSNKYSGPDAAPLPSTQAEWKAWFELHPEPAIQSYPPLQDWLNKLDAVCDWQIRLGKHQRTTGGYSTMVEQWRARGTAPFILLIHSHGNGWDVFTGHHENNVEMTIHDAERRIMPSKTTPVDHLIEAKMSLDEASRKIASIQDARIAEIWRDLGKLTKQIHEARVELDTLLPEAR